MTAPPPIRIGTRASPLARWQAQWVADALAARGVAVALVPITTRGDAQPREPVQSLGGTGLFTRELQRALVDGRIDVAVHSLKDLPTEPAAGLVLAAVPPRESCRDALVGREGKRLAELPAGAAVGTGSLRRQSQLLYARPDLKIVPVRGNVDTRLRKLEAGDFAALVLAEAGLIRLGLASRATHVFTPAEMMPAVGQGALGLETRADDDLTRAALAALDDPRTHAAVLAERALLAALGGGCLAPIGAWARSEPGGAVALDAVVLRADGSRRIFASGAGPIGDPLALGRHVARRLAEQGAGDLIDAARGGGEPPDAV